MTADEGRLRFRERQAAQREHAALLARTASLVSSTIVGLRCIQCARRKCRIGYDRCALCIYAHAGAGTAGQPRQPRQARSRERGPDRGRRERSRKSTSHRLAIAAGMRERWAAKRAAG